MSAERLREAAAQARAEADIARAVAPSLVNIYADDCGSERDARRHLALADWLETTSVIATWEDHVGRGPVASVVRRALAVADAYLGSEAAR